MSSPTVSTTGDVPVVQRQLAQEDVRVVSARRSVSVRMGEVWKYRELLLSMIRKELKVKYKDSVLGFAWSMLNPLFTLTIYYVVFQIILKNGMPMFAIYLLAGLLVWNLFSNSLAGATGSITGSGSIIKKVAFPREILPLASVGAGLFNFMLQLIVMLAALAAFMKPPSAEFLLLVPVALAVLVLLTCALSIFLSAVNVYLRDTQHLLELALMFWFWATPVVYQYGLVSTRLANKGWWSWLPFINPITPITLAFQRAFYNKLDYPDPSGKIQHVLPHNGILWYLGHLGIVALISCGLLYGALVVFGRLEGNFAEEL
jgi:ABC-2 type transport system permease protein